MGDEPKSTLPPELQAANAANRAAHWKQFEADAAAQAAKPASPVDDLPKGTLSTTFREAREAVSTGWHVIKDFVANPEAKIDQTKTDVKQTLDDAAIKPYQGSTSVDRHNALNPGSKL